jgi:outer membrane autotransporter protein
MFSLIDFSNVAEVPITATAKAYGIRGNEDNDRLTNSSTIETSALASAEAGDFAVSLLDVSGGANTAMTAFARNIGMAGDDGDDTIINDTSGSIIAGSTSATGNINGLFDIAGFGLVDTDAKSRSWTTGIDGGWGDDTLTNNGSIMATADADAVHFGVRADIVAVALANINAVIETTATAVGIDGYVGNDNITNNRLIDVNATASTYPGRVNITPIAVELESPDITASPVSGALIAGLTGGEGEDTIDNSGTIQGKASANTLGGVLDATVLGRANAVAAARAESLAIGIDGGFGDDSLDNHRVIDIDAESSVTLIAASAGLDLVPVIPVVFLGADVSTAAEADVIGINGGEGNDEINNYGLIRIDSTTHANDIEVTGKLGLSVSGGGGNGGSQSVETPVAQSLESPVAVQAAPVQAMAAASDTSGRSLYVDATTSRLSNATGIDGGNGDNDVFNDGTIEATSDANALGVAANIAVSAKIGTSSVLSPATLSDSGSAAVIVTETSGIFGSDEETTGLEANTMTNSVATGIRTGGGVDWIHHTGIIDVESTASATDIAAKVNLAIPSDFVSLFVPTPSFLMDSSSLTGAFATGIEAGNGDDEVINDGFMEVQAITNGVSVSAALETQIVIPLDFLIFDMRADTNSQTFATATGINGDSSTNDIPALTGSDTLRNNNFLDVTANATSSSWSVVGTLGGAALGNAAAVTNARATGIDGGGNNDDIDNDGILSASANSKANGVSIEATIGLGAAMGDVSVIPNAFATGIDGGDGNDLIDNAGLLTASSSSTAVGVGVNVSALFTGSVGHANSDVSATSSGMAGGSGNDVLTNAVSGQVTSGAAADSDITQVDVTVAVGASIADSSSDTEATAGGIEGGDGEDTIRSYGTVTSKANANINARSISVTLLSTGFDEFPLPQGANAEVSGAGASATSTGISGDGDNDDILWTGLVDVDAVSHADALMVAVIGTGATMGDADITSRAKASGVAGGDGNDTINAQGKVESSATATSADASVTISGLAGSQGASGATVMVLAAEATGIDGGLGDDVINISSQVDAVSCANSGPDPVDDQCPPDDINNPLIGANGVTISLTHGGLQDLSVNSNSTAVAAAGGGGNDMITNMLHNTINARADAEGRAGTFGLTVLGGVMSKVNTDITATATALAGGDGDDILDNMGSVVAAAESNSKDWSMNLALFGSTVGDTTTVATARATGMDGNDGDDDVLNHGTVMTNADATAGGTVIDINATFDPLQLYGESTVGASNTEANATATGLAGGAGNDYLLSTDEIFSDAESYVLATETTYKSFGASISGGGTDAIATAVGMDGGEGDDTIENTRLLSMLADAYSGTTNTSITGIGESSIDAETGVLADAVGVLGGQGNDTINIKGTIVATADANTLDKGWSLTLAGEGDQDAALIVDSKANGAFGGEGDDMLINALDNFITMWATATGSSNTVDINLAGETNGESNMDITAATTGLGGDAGSDGLVNRGVIDGIANSTATFSNVDFDFAGTAHSNIGNADTVADTLGIGMSGDDGDDGISNAGEIYIQTTATVATTMDSVIDIFGSAGTSAILAARPESTGIDGGADNDFIENLRLVDVMSTAKTDLLAGSAFTFGGVASDTAQIMAESGSTGIQGGSGLDVIDNHDRVMVLAVSTMEVGSNSKVAFGAARSAGLATAVANAVGIAGGDDQDRVTNLGAIESRALAVITSTDSSYAFAGDPSANPVVSSASHATGIEGGEGADLLVNEAVASITVNASVKPSTTGDSRATFDFGTVSGSTTLNTLVTANGIKGEQGDDILRNLGDITVVADSDASAANTSKAGIFAGDTVSSADASAVFYAYAMDAGDGNNTISSSGTINNTLTLLGSEEADGPTVLAKSSALGGDVSFESDASATATSTLSAELVGLGAGSGDNTVINSNTVTLLNAAQTKAEAIANGNGFDGDGSATASVWAGANDPNDTLNSPRVLSATGISVGDGNNTISNQGRLDIQVTPTGIASGSADGDFVGSAFSTLNATVHARATGIQAGDGSNSITNESDIIVLANPTATSTSTVSPGLFARATINEHATAVANGVGIQAGNGGNSIINSGLVDVQANASATASTGTSTVSTAIAILSGSGNDTIINADNGILKTTVAGVEGDGTGIDAGSGNDLVQLLDTSAVTGSVMLGEGDDVIAFSDASSTSGMIMGGSGQDTLRLDDQRRLDLLSGNLSSIELFEANQGTIAVDGDYTLLDGGGFQVELYAGGYGQLAVNGAAAIGVQSDLTVIASRRIYFGGDIFDVLVGDTVSGTFATENLSSSRFLSFDVNYLPAEVQVAANVLPFAAAASNKLQRAVGGYLDRIAPAATGDLAEVISTFQFLSPDAEFDTVYSSLSPDTHDNYTRASYDGVTQYLDVLDHRMQTRRVGSLLTGSVAQPVAGGSLLLASNGPVADMGPLHADDAMAVPAWWRDFWGTAFGRWGDQDGEDGYTGFDYDILGVALGFDRPVNEHLLLGVSAAYTDTDVDQDKGRGDGDIEGWIASFYGNYSFDRAYVDATLSYGQNDYDARREVRVGTIKRTARSDHDGDVFAASLGSGYPISREDTVLEPFGRLQYIRLDEDAFTETGADSVNQRISSRDTDSLTSEIGLRVGRVYRKAAGRLITDASVAWLHDFDIDDRTITTRYTGSPASSFSIPGQDVERNGVTLGLGVGFETKKGISTSLNYNGEFRDGFSAHGVIGRVSYRF